MLTSLRKLFARPRPGSRPRLGVEALDDRTLPSADLAVLSARLDTPTAVAFEYRTSSYLGLVPVGVYRSADPVFDPADERVGGATLIPTFGGTWTGRVALGAELPADPARKHVLVVADPAGRVAERDEGNNAASFRKLVLGGVAHGLTLTGQLPAWFEPTARALEADGYDRVIRFDWLALSQVPVPGGAVLAGWDLAGRVRAAAAELAARPTDVVDLHLIGHSRGSGVVSQALLALDLVPGPRPLRLGYTTQTLLDPHVAGNTGSLEDGLAQLASGATVNTVGGFSYNPANPLGVLFAYGTLAFQAVSQDPPAFVPAGVDRAEVVYQRLAWDQTAPDAIERVIGLNFQSPPPAAIPNLSGRPVVATDVGAFGVGHFEVPTWYLTEVLL